MNMVHSQYFIDWLLDVKLENRHHKLGDRTSMFMYMETAATQSRPLTYKTLPDKLNSY